MLGVSTVCGQPRFRQKKATATEEACYLLSATPFVVHFVRQCLRVLLVPSGHGTEVTACSLIGQEQDEARVMLRGSFSF